MEPKRRPTLFRYRARPETNLLPVPLRYRYLIAIRIRCAIIRCMRTTLDIDDDVLAAAKELAASQKSTAGRILSEYFRRGLHAPAASPAGAVDPETGCMIRNGFPVFPAGGRIVTMELVQKIMEEEGI